MHKWPLVVVLLALGAGATELENRDGKSYKYTANCAGTISSGKLKANSSLSSLGTCSGSDTCEVSVKGAGKVTAPCESKVVVESGKVSVE